MSIYLLKLIIIFIKKFYEQKIILKTKIKLKLVKEYLKSQRCLVTSLFWGIFVNVLTCIAYQNPPAVLITVAKYCVVEEVSQPPIMEIKCEQTLKMIYTKSVIIIEMLIHCLS